MKITKGQVIREAITITLLTGGAFVMAVGISVFLVPRKISIGGFTGIATLISYLTSEYASINLPIGVLSMILNIPLFLFGFRLRGVRFAIYSLYATIVFSLFVDLIKFQIDIEEEILAAIYGGIFVGFGLGVIIKIGASTGGSDMLAQLVQKKFPLMSAGVLILIIDAIIVGLSAIVFGLQVALYSFLIIYISSKVIDFVILGRVNTVAAHIMTEKAEEISKTIFDGIKRGVTGIRIKGMYTGNENMMMLICIVQKSQLLELKNIIKNIDDKAFMYTVPTKEVIGEGFLSGNNDIVTGIQQRLKKYDTND